MTSGGNTKARVILHPVVLDHDLSLYPTPAVIRTVVERCLACAAAVGAETIAFPVLGGGTASKNLDPRESVRTIVKTAREHLEEGKLDASRLRSIFLCVFEQKDVPDDLEALLAADA